MARFLHIADSHLSATEYDYSAGVLKEIVGAAAALDVDAILVAGHLATEPDAFADILGRATCEWLWAPGAGEPQSAAPNVQLLDDRPFELTTCAGVEILALPHRSTFADYRGWAVPEKATARRLALVHAPVITMPSLATDAPGGAIDPDLFERWQVDYAALGSAHLTCAPSTYGTTLMADPGSARVTSAVERGVRGGFLVELDDQVHARWVAFASAGQRREVSVPVAIDGRLPDLNTDSWGPADAVELRLSGVLHGLEPETVERHAREAWGGRVRELGIDVRRLSSVSDAKLAAVARRLSEASGNDEVALRAREQSLALLVTAG